MNISTIDDILSQITSRLSKLEGSRSYERLMTRLSSLSRYEDEPMDYPDPGGVVFPDTVQIAFAVCHPECGTREFIVDGSTQLSDRCGSTMFRTEKATYNIQFTKPVGTNRQVPAMSGDRGY